MAVLLNTIKQFCLCCILTDYEIEMCKPGGCPLFNLRLGKPRELLEMKEEMKTTIKRKQLTVRMCVGEQYGTTPIVEYVKLPTIRQSWVGNDDLHDGVVHEASELLGNRRAGSSEQPALPLP